jgi:Lrp/AsnC family transcriptional regulator
VQSKLAVLHGSNQTFRASALVVAPAWGSVLSLHQMDLIDRKILDLLQRDATLPIAEIASRVGLSQTPCWKRIQKLEANGVIERRVAILNPEKLGLGLTVFVSIETIDHSQEWLARFAETVSAMSEVLEFYRMAGDVDYMLRVVVADMAAYDAFYKRLIATIPLKNVTSRLAMERIVSKTAYPLEPSVRNK